MEGVYVAVAYKDAIIAHKPHEYELETKSVQNANRNQCNFRYEN